jgi:hypothetical protein
VSHKPTLPGNGSRNKDPAVDYFYSAAKHRSRGVLWSIFAPALIHKHHPGEHIRSDFVVLPIFARIGIE